MTELPDWMYAPRVEGWFAEDLDHMPQAPRHTELIDGALVFMMSPQRSWHGRLLTSLTVALMAQAPEGFEVEREMTIRLDAKNRPEPDLLVATVPYDARRTWFEPSDVALVVEVVSPESAERDRGLKFLKYAKAGIGHYWCIEEEAEDPVVHAYELDRPTGAYVGVGVFRHELKLSVPFPITLDLDALRPGPAWPDRK